MKELSFYSTNTTPYLGIVLAILSILPIVLIHTILKPKYSKEKNSKYGKISHSVFRTLGVLSSDMLYGAENLKG